MFSHGRAAWYSIPHRMGTFSRNILVDWRETCRSPHVCEWTPPVLTDESIATCANQILLNDPMQAF